MHLFSKNYYRAPFFLLELEQFLLLCRQFDLNPLSMRGSIAGAMGPAQFMPSTYRHYGVHLSSRSSSINDLFNSIASIANYLHKLGWNRNLWLTLPVHIKSHKQGTPLKLPETSFKLKYTVNALRHFDINYPKLRSNQKVRFIRLQGPHQKNQYWLGSRNFYLITRYNRSTYYAMAVSQLSQRIKQQYKQRISDKH